MASRKASARTVTKSAKKAQEAWPGQESPPNLSTNARRVSRSARAKTSRRGGASRFARPKTIAFVFPRALFHRRGSAAISSSWSVRKTRGAPRNSTSHMARTSSASKEWAVSFARLFQSVVMRFLDSSLTDSGRGGFSRLRRDTEPGGPALRDRAPEPLRPAEKETRQPEGLSRPPRKVEGVLLAHDQPVPHLDLRDDHIHDGALTPEQIAGRPLHGAGTAPGLCDVELDREIFRAAREADPHFSDVRSREKKDGILERRLRRVHRGHRLAVAAGERFVETRERGPCLGIRHLSPKSIRIASSSSRDSILCPTPKRYPRKATGACRAASASYFESPTKRHSASGTRTRAEASRTTAGSGLPAPASFAEATASSSGARPVKERMRSASGRFGFV